MKKMLLILVFLVTACTGGRPSPTSELVSGGFTTSLSELTASDPALFKRVAGQVQMVEFFAYWCTVCQGMAPIVHELDAKYSDKILFTYLDIDDPANAPAMKDLQYVGRPHFYLLDEDGTILNQWLGAVSEDELSAALSKSIGK